MRKLFSLVAIGAVTLTACSENAMAPSAPEATSAPAVQGSTADLAATDTIRFSMTIYPWQTTSIYLGNGNSLIFPAHSVCDPNTSGYGPGSWDKPCTPTSSTITENVKAWLDKYGHVHVDFDKHLRFVPTTAVVLSFADLQASRDPMFNILYCPSANSQCVDESKTDVTLVTVRDPITGKVTRRIKHFSGYNVAAGDASEGLMNKVSGASSWSFIGTSVSTLDFNLKSVSDVEAQYPGISYSDAQDMLERINAGRKVSGYILASGREQE